MKKPRRKGKKKEKKRRRKRAEREQAESWRPPQLLVPLSSSSDKEAPGPGKKLRFFSLISPSAQPLTRSSRRYDSRIARLPRSPTIFAVFSSSSCKFCRVGIEGLSRTRVLASPFDCWGISEWIPLGYFVLAADSREEAGPWFAPGRSRWADGFGWRWAKNCFWFALFMLWLLLQLQQ